MSDKTFVDTNILIYAHDADAGDKQRVAARVLEDLWESRLGVISTQVLQEFYVNVTRKIARPVERSVAREIVRAYGAWQLERPGRDEILHASELEQRYRLQFWDALIVATAIAGGASVLLSEDFFHGRRVAGIVIRNPFLEERT